MGGWRSLGPGVASVSSRAPPTQASRSFFQKLYHTENSLTVTEKSSAPCLFSSELSMSLPALPITRTAVPATHCHDMLLRVPVPVVSVYRIVRLLLLVRTGTTIRELLLQYKYCTTNTTGTSTVLVQYSYSIYRYTGEESKACPSCNYCMYILLQVHRYSSTSTSTQHSAQ